MNAGDIMTSNVVTVRPDTSVSRLAHLLLENRISAVPVVDDQDCLVGIVSEGDLLAVRHGEACAPGGCACSMKKWSAWRNSQRRVG